MINITTSQNSPYDRLPNVHPGHHAIEGVNDAADVSFGSGISELFLLFGHVVVSPDDGRLDPRPVPGIDERLARL